MNKQELYRLLHSTSDQFNRFLNRKNRENNILFLETNDESSKKVFEKYGKEFLNEVEEKEFIFKNTTLYSSSLGYNINLIANKINITNINFSANIEGPTAKTLEYGDYFYKISGDTNSRNSVITKFETIISDDNSLLDNKTFYKVIKETSDINLNTNFQINELNLTGSKITAEGSQIIFTKKEEINNKEDIQDPLKILLEDDSFEDVLYDDRFREDNDRVRIIKSENKYYIECIGNALRELTRHKRFLLFGDPNIPLEIVETEEELENGVKFSYHEDKKDNNIKKIFITCNGLYEYNSFSESKFNQK